MFARSSVMRVTNGIPLGSPLPLTAVIINYVESLKDMVTRDSMGCVAYNGKIVIVGGFVRCAFSDRNLHSRMPLDPTHVRLKLLPACDQ
jgi:hypothetical protein